MLLIQIGQEIRRLRTAAGLTQAQLATLAGIARETLSRLESGTYNDIGFKKLQTLLTLVGGELVARNATRAATPDYVQRALSAANTSHRERLHADELVQALLTGHPVPGKAGHLLAVLDDLSPENIEGLIAQVGAIAGNRAKVARGTLRLRAKLALPP